MASASSSTSGTRPAGAEAPLDEPWEEMLLVGLVARTQGNRGEVIVNATTDFVEERFAPGAELWWRGSGGQASRVQVASFRMHQGRPVLRFDGAVDIGTAERFAGGELKVSRTAAMALPPHVYYHHELTGCAVVTGAGAVVGTVQEVEGDGGSVRLVVSGEHGDVLIPFVQAFCEVDVAARRIVVTPPEGLLELNRTGGARGMP